MMDTFIDPATNDIPLNGGFVDGIEMVRQRIEIMLNTNRGEWFLDSDAGIPWTEWVVTKGLDPRIAALLIRRKILAIDGVVRVDRVDTDSDKFARSITFSGTAYAADATEIAFSTSSGDTGFAGINGTHLTAVHIRPIGRR